MKKLIITQIQNFTEKMIRKGKNICKVFSKALKDRDIDEPTISQLQTIDDIFLYCDHCGGYYNLEEMNGYDGDNICNHFLSDIEQE